MLIDLAVSFSFGYILGSIPFGFVLVYMATSQDIRTIGSGNIGATNVLRSGHKELAFLTLILDALKGTIAFFYCLFMRRQRARHLLDLAQWLVIVFLYGCVLPAERVWRPEWLSSLLLFLLPD